jgi:hypothetical protein
VGWSADNKAVITRDEATGLVFWWDRQTGDRLREAQTDLPPGYSIARPDGRFATTEAQAGLDIWEIARGHTALTLVPLSDGQWLAVRPDGHYRASPGVEEELVYVVQTDAGQELLTPAEFARQYPWQNEARNVRLTSSAPPARGRSRLGRGRHFFSRSLPFFPILLIGDGAIWASAPIVAVHKGICQSGPRPWGNAMPEKETARFLVVIWPS